MFMIQYIKVVCIPNGHNRSIRFMLILSNRMALNKMGIYVVVVGGVVAAAFFHCK